MTAATQATIPHQAETDEALQKLEREQSERIEFQRRYNLLRILLPTLGIPLWLSVPNAILTDLNTPGIGFAGLFSLTSSTLQVIVGVTGWLISFLAFRRRNVVVASIAMICGVSGLIILLLLNDALLSAGQLPLGRVPEFALLLVPIVLASVLGGPLVIALTTICTSSLTIVMLTFSRHDAAYTAFVQQNAGGYVLYTVPIGLQIVIGAIIFGSQAGFRRAQRQLSTVRAAYERERELDRLKSQFIININHELRTPLMALQGYLILARDFGHAGELEQQERMFALGLESMHHVNTLVESILDVRRLETDVTPRRIASVALYETILKASGMVDSHIVGKERALKLHLPDELRVMADEDRLCQVLINLLTNACKYSPPGSAIEISAQPYAGTAAGGSASDATPMVQITVRDHGLGIPPDQIGLLFQRFVRLERDIASSVTGTGLGLALCRAYIEAMGGTIWAESAGIPGEGSAFSFTLPADTQAGS